MQWSRGNVSFIFNGEESRSDTLSLVVLDNDSKSYTRMKLMGAVRMYVHHTSTPLYSVREVDHG